MASESPADLYLLSSLLPSLLFRLKDKGQELFKNGETDSHADDGSLLHLAFCARWGLCPVLKAALHKTNAFAEI